MTEHIKYPEEVREDAWNRALRLFSELPKTLMEERPRPDKRKTNNIGW